MTTSKNRTSEKTSLVDRIGALIQRNRKVFLFSAIAIVVGIVIVVVATEVNSARIANATAEIEQLIKDFETWQSTSAAEPNTPIEAESLIASAGDLVRRYPRLFAGQYASFIIARTNIIQGQSEQAAEQFLRTYNMSPNSILGPISLFNHALVLEDLERYAESTQSLLQLVDRHADATIDIPRALFALGRIAETERRVADALRYYDSILDEYPMSSWTNLANNRILTIRTAGAAID